ncbi:hypothetical protein FT663_01621 [Candidozyma haemuli var. vulneris]|uniref:Amine oxidase domain-containing protein n=1 Tax=Candidozyma haemuli TaxID=45357 RepID=A0A2V1B1F2_9ASCO|nr:hypothetical protein CXQ85_004123 [[Candida] haemuloni]KAF3994121.1 hypothetical protein FT663_01621 [[Candida] haemuloni var. vulneris]KAF3994287.1 hypothetical protein FT662_00156 [[Candida] haemuloni var. vulneris]PVH23829.1 hypothetical protein CXQ85_004123 [[Candida] haemuloni]
MSSKSVTIIGAGIAGLKAAEVLLKSGRFAKEDIVILEAQDRVGGRIKTDKDSSKLGVSYDLGAAWFHDALTNSVLYDSIDNGTFVPAKDGYFDDKDIAMYASDQDGPLDSGNLKLVRVLEDMEKFMELYFMSDLGVKDISLDELAKLYVEKYKVFLTPEQLRYCCRVFRYYELWFGIPSYDISAKYAPMDHQGRNLYNKIGHGFAIDHLVSQIDCEISKQHQVTKISRNIRGGPKKNKVELADGSTIDTDYVIVTVPLSILKLKEGPQKITWEPPLPKPITEALDQISVGSLGKVIFEFDMIWWDKNQDRFDIIPDDVSSFGVVPKSWEYPSIIVNYARVKPGTPSLVLLTQSPVTDYLEEHPEQAWPFLKPMLSKLNISSFSVPDPINTIVTDWTKNPFARGAYSAVRTGDCPDDLIIHLSGENEGVGMGSGSTIRFAGEHTIADGSGCIHGAYDSGKREAEWILNDSK